MPPEVVSQLPSLGVAGLLFVMWWSERQERTRVISGLRVALQHAEQTAKVNGSLLDVIRANTEALTALREELRHQRRLEAEWVRRLTAKLDELAA